MHRLVAALVAATVVAAAPAGDGASGASPGVHQAPLPPSGERLASSDGPPRQDLLADNVLAPSGVLYELHAAVDPQDPALAALPGADLMNVLPSAMPTPPKTVVRQTYFGNVTIDHEAHLARHARCVQCHGSGPIRKIRRFTPKVAHERCVGCHQQAGKGPERCVGCHVKASAPAVAGAGADGLAAPPPPPAVVEPDPANVASALAAFDKPETLLTSEPFHRRLEFGLAAGSGLGVSVRLATHHDWWVMAESVEALRGDQNARTLALMGVGYLRPANKGTVVEVTAVGGLDLIDRPVTAVFPALGVRAGVEWRQPLPTFFQQFGLSCTLLGDIGSRAFGQDVGGAVFYGSFTTGFRIP